MDSIIKQASVSLDQKIPSVNLVYNCARKGTRVWKYKVPEVKNFCAELEAKIKETELVDLKSIEKSDISSIVTHITFLIKDNLNGRDVTNMIKVVEDSIVKVTKIDDKLTRKFISEKVSTPLEAEGLIIVIEVEMKNGES